MTENHVKPCTANIEGHAKALFITLNALSCCLATSGNMMVLVAIYKTRSLRTISNFFICSLATADLLVGLLINPLYIALVAIRVWVSDHPLYQTENYLWIQSLTVTTFSLAAVSVDRYIAITKVFRYQEILTKKRCTAIISSIWVFSLAIASVTFFIDPEDGSKVWVTCQAITVGIPLAAMGYCYYHIYRAAQRQSGQILMHEGAVKIKTSQTQIQAITKNRKALKTVAIVIGLFFILFIPNFVFSIIEISTTERCQKLKVYQSWLWSIWLGFSSSVFNPWVYAIRSREFREAYRKNFVPIHQLVGHQRRKCKRTSKVQNI